MKAETLRDEVLRDLTDFAWSQWAQMGVSGSPPVHPERRAADPEALLLFTLEIGRADPRLFDEVLDWLVTNEPLISVQRLRNLCADETDRALADAALGSVARWRPRARLSPTSPVRAAPRSLEPLFLDLHHSIETPEPSFAQHGFARREFTPSGKSQAPDYTAAINFAFRTRRLLGIGVRAEALRTLLTIRAPRLAVQVVTRSAGFAPRNVREGLAQLDDAGVVNAITVGDERHYSTDPERWATLLNVSASELPLHYDWIAALRSLTAVVRWLRGHELDDLTDYMRASEARSLIDGLEPDLRYAGIPVFGATAKGAAYWSAFVETVRSSVAHVRALPDESVSRTMSPTQQDIA